MRGGAVTNILRIIDLEKGTIVGGVPLRVPNGYEPAIRNQVFSMASVPNGFAVSFVGDRKFFIVYYSGTIKNEIILGESDHPKPTITKSNGSIPALLKKLVNGSSNLLML